jgi:hypothetical protein
MDLFVNHALHARDFFGLWSQTEILALIMQMTPIRLSATLQQAKDLTILRHGDKSSHFL